MTLLERIKDVKRKKKAIKFAKESMTLGNLENMATALMMQHGSVVRELRMLAQEAHKVGLNHTGICSDDYFLLACGGIMFRHNGFALRVSPGSIYVYRLANSDSWEGAFEETVYYGSLTCMEKECILRQNLTNPELYRCVEKMLMTFNPRGLLGVFMDVITPQLVEVESEYEAVVGK